MFQPHWCLQSRSTACTGFPCGKVLDWGGLGQAFFSWLGYPSPRGECLPAFSEILGALSGITPPPPPSGGRPRVGWDFLGEKSGQNIYSTPEQLVARFG